MNNMIKTHLFMPPDLYLNSLKLKLEHKNNYHKKMRLCAWRMFLTQQLCYKTQLFQKSYLM